MIFAINVLIIFAIISQIITKQRLWKARYIASWLW